MDNSPQHLFLASGVNNGEGFWIVGIKNCDENILEDKNLLDCHRKELIGNKSAKDILLAINLNINNLLNELRNKSFLIESPSMGISFDIPLDILESIFDLKELSLMFLDPTDLLINNINKFLNSKKTIKFIFS